MKKLLTLFSAFILVGGLSSSLVSCSRIFGTDLSKIENYDWSSEEPYFNGYDNVSKISSPTNPIKLDINSESESVSEKYFNLSEKPTSFKTVNDVKKQAPTSVPLNSHFLPNGNLVSDLSIISKADYYHITNEFVDWTSSEDFDAKYNTAKIPLQPTKKTMNKWVESQDERVKEMNMATVIESTSKASTIVGSKRTYERSFNNYQYNDIMVSWAGAADEGIIVPPAKNQIEKAHLNGTKILGNIFLDGYHGLTSEILRGFLEKDEQGNYKVVDVLIQMSIDLGFDGWFWNNEPNGSNPNGFVVDNSIMYEIMGQLKTKIDQSTDPEVRSLIVFGYKNQGVLRSNDGNNASEIDSEEIYKNTHMFLNDFYVFSNEVESYIKAKELSEEERFNIFSMYNPGAWVDGGIWYDKDKIGRKDMRDLNYFPFKNKYEKETKDELYVDSSGKIDDEALINDYFIDDYETNKDNQFHFRTSEENPELGGARNSISLFASHTPYDLASNDMDNLSEQKSVELDTYGMVAANNYDDMMYTGANKYLSENDTGVVLFPGSEPNEEIFDGKSYGIGDLVQEKTVLIDGNNYFKTNFSTGQGNHFVTINNDGTRQEINNYPWSNTNIADIQPTYKWDIKKIVDNEYINIPTNEISGYYDYYNPYLKGNSISLGSGFDEKGQIKNATWDSNTTYEWNIMGSNYEANDPKEISMKVRIPDSMDDIKLLVKGENNKILQPTTQNITQIDNLSEENDGYKWVELSGTYSQPVGSIGLEFTTPNDLSNFVISCGEIIVSTNGGESKTSSLREEQTRPPVNIESIIERDNEKYIRFYLDESNVSNDDIYNYYEVYYKDESGQLVRITEGNSPYFFINGIDVKYNNFYIKQISGDNQVEWYSFSLTN